MLRINQSVSAKGALRYFDEALAHGDYYSQNECSIGTWGGGAAEMLGLGGPVQRQDFAKLTANIHPGSGGNLTPRTKENRTAGYDFTFSVPKSVSLFLALEPNSEVHETVMESFRETMSAIEAEMKTRVRGANEEGKQRDDERTSGNAVWASFVHDTTRPVDGMPDPHLHIHAYVLNATFDRAENRWKAGLFRDLVADKAYWEASFNSRLAQRLLSQGYAIRRTDVHFELASVSRELIEKFSKRTHEIERQAEEYLAAFKEKARVLAGAKDISHFEAERLLLGKPDATAVEIKATVLAEIGAKSRESKSKGEMDPQKRLAHWIDEMSVEEQQSLSLTSVKVSQSLELLTRQKAQDLALSELFERSSVASRRRIAAAVLRRGIGNLSVREADFFVTHDAQLVGKGERVTTNAVLREERRSVENVRAGQGGVAALDIKKRWLKQIPSPTEHQRAIGYLLSTTNQFSLIRGRAGTGKTTMMKSAVVLIQRYSGREVAVFAPSSASTDVLQAEGFDRARTFQMLEKSTKLQEEVKDKIIWVDEAGFLGARQMGWLTGFARANNIRVIFSGDTAQHHAVERGDALRVLEASRVLEPVSLTEIFRQKDPELKAIVKDLSEGYVDKAVDALVAQRRLIEIEEEPDRLSALVDKHLEGIRAGKDCLIVAPTHTECRTIAAHVRTALRVHGLLSGPDVELTRLQNTGWTEAQCSDPTAYRLGLIVEFNRRCSGFGKNEQWEVKEVGLHGVVVSNARHGERLLVLNKAENFTVYSKERLTLAVGDTVRVTKNHHYDVHRHVNNDVIKVVKIDGKELILSNGKRMNAGGYVHLDQGQAVTSHSSQGKTVDQVLVSVPIATFNLVNAAQLYVSMSRAKEAALVFTESAVALREAVAEYLSERLSALELVGQVERGKKELRSVKVEQRKGRIEKVKEGKRDRMLLAELYKSGRLRSSEELLVRVETVKRLLVVLDTEEREKYEPALFRRLAAFMRQADTVENHYNRELERFVRVKSAQIECIEAKLGQEIEVSQMEPSSVGSQRITQLSKRLAKIREIAEAYGVHAGKVEELAEDKLRRSRPDLVKGRDQALLVRRSKAVSERMRTSELEQVMTKV